MKLTKLSKKGHSPSGYNTIRVDELLKSKNKQEYPDYTTDSKAYLKLNRAQKTLAGQRYSQVERS